MWVFEEDTGTVAPGKPSAVSLSVAALDESGANNVLVKNSPLHMKESIAQRSKKTVSEYAVESA